jgi:UDP-N-acetylglucosamine:LPS N-acetylglucosamine transferase
MATPVRGDDGKVMSTKPSPHKPLICIVSSCGGHLTEIRSIVKPQSHYDLMYVLNDKIKLSGDMQGCTQFIRHSERDWLFIINLLEAWKILTRSKPQIVVSAGAGPVIPFALVSKLLGIPTVFVETVARVTAPSMSGRLMYYLADRFFYQWESLAEFFPRGTYGGALI